MTTTGWGVVLAAGLALGAPGPVLAAPAPSAATADGAELEELLAAFVPEEALLVVALPSRTHWDALEFTLDEAWGVSLPRLDRMTSRFGGLPDDLAADLPLAVVYGWGEHDGLLPLTAFLPCADPDAAVAGHDGGGAAHGSYAVLATGPRLQVGGSRLGELTFDGSGDVIVRAELGELQERSIGRQLRTMLAAMETMQSAGSQQEQFLASTAPIYAMVRRAVESVGLLEARVGLNETALALRAGLEVADLPRVPPTGDALALLDRVPDSLPSRLVGVGGGGVLSSAMGPMNQSAVAMMTRDLPDGDREAAEAWFTETSQLGLRLMGPGAWAMGMGMGGSMRSLMVTRVDEAQALVDRFVELYDSSAGEPLGMVTRLMPTVQVGESTVQRIHLRMTETYIDRVLAMSGGAAGGVMGDQVREMMSLYLPPDGSILEIAASDGFVLFGTSPQGGLVQQSLQGAGGRQGIEAPAAPLILAGAVDVGDLAQIIETSLSMLPDAPRLEQSHSVPFELVMSREADGLGFTVDVPLAAFGALLRDFRD